MFADIAPRYDLLNHLLSLNVDRYWRWRTTRLAPPVADPAAGADEEREDQVLNRQSGFPYQVAQHRVLAETARTARGKHAGNPVSYRAANPK